MTGHLHPITQITESIVAYLEQRGFEVVFGPEIETEENNFDRLNIPRFHPAREEHDTIYLSDNRVLRTHTSPGQLRAMENRQPPVRLVIPGRVYRREATDATHNHTFHQLEGLVIDETVSMAELVGTLEGMLTALFAQRLEFRLRPSYFPFVEPALEIDIAHRGAWLEVLGAGMVHPNVLKAMRLDAQRYQGFAFGVGLERLINLISGVDDVRWNLSSDYRYLGQF